MFLPGTLEFIDVRTKNFYNAKFSPIVYPYLLQSSFNNHTNYLQNEKLKFKRKLLQKWISGYFSSDGGEWNS